MRLSKPTAFYLLASIPLFFLASSSAPTPLYAVYQAAWGFTPITITVVFGIYAFAVLAALLVFVIDRRSFGWTMALRLDPGTLVAAPALGLLAGVLGGIVPALLMARISPAEALREE